MVPVLHSGLIRLGKSKEQMATIHSMTLTTKGGYVILNEKYIDITWKCVITIVIIAVGFIPFKVLIHIFRNNKKDKNE